MCKVYCIECKAISDIDDWSSFSNSVPYGDTYCEESTSYKCPNCGEYDTMEELPDTVDCYHCGTEIDTFGLEYFEPSECFCDDCIENGTLEEGD